MLLIIVGEATIVPAVIEPNTATYWIELLLVAIELPAESVMEIVKLAVGLVLSGLYILVNSRIASKSGLT